MSLHNAEDLSRFHVFVRRDPHVTAEDFGFFEEAIQHPAVDIYVPEVCGFDESYKQGLLKIASGDSRVYQDVMARTDLESNFAPFFRGLFASRKILGFYDATETEVAADPRLADFGRQGISLQTATSADLLKIVPTVFERGVAFITTRDTLIAQRMATELPLLAQSHPRLKTKNEIKVLLTIGDNHQLIDGRLKEHGFTVETNGEPVLGPREDAINKLLHGQEIDEADIMSTAAIMYLRGFVKHRSTNELRRIMTKALAETTVADLDKGLEAYKKDGFKGIASYIAALLKSKGLEGRGLEIVDPADKKPPIKKKSTVERRNGQTGVRTSVF